MPSKDSYSLIREEKISSYRPQAYNPFFQKSQRKINSNELIYEGSLEIKNVTPERIIIKYHPEESE